VAANKFVAKVASDLHKPGGLTVVPAGGEQAFLAPLPVSRLWGAGKVTVERLAALGLATVGDVASMRLDALTAALGAGAARHFHELAHGRDERPLVCVRPPQSISRETTFETDLCDDQALLAMLLRLAEDVGRRLRRRELLAATVRLKLRFPPFETHTRQARLVPPSAEDVPIFRGARALLEAARRAGAPVRLIGVGAADLLPRATPVQGELFGTSRAAPRGAIDGILDAVRERFGDDAERRAAAEPARAPLDFDRDDLDELRPPR
jgi:DNA polymerase-4